MKLTYQNKNLYLYTYTYTHIFCSCISCFQASFQRSNSHDKVRKIVAEEGRTARNLIAWSVPLENKDDDGNYSTVFPQLFYLLFLCSLELLAWKHVSDVGFGIFKQKVMLHVHSIVLIFFFLNVYPAVDSSL